MQDYPTIQAKKILIVDDQPNSVLPMVTLLEIEGYHSKTIDSHNGIFREIEEYNPNLILLDIMLMGTDGRYVCELLKSTNRTKNIPIILISAMDKASALAEKCGSDGFLHKPFDMDDALAQVRALLNLN